MEQFGVPRDNGLSMNMEHPPTGGRHRLTDTYGRNMTDAQKAYYYSLSPRDALAYDLYNARNIYMSQGLYWEMHSQLKAFPIESIKLHPNIFTKGMY